MKNPSPKILWMLTMVLLILPGSSFTQSQITGLVADSEGIPVPFANVLLLNPADSALVSGNITEDDGSYILPNVEEGNYLVAISLIGYMDYYSEGISISDGSNHAMPVAVINENSIELSEVQVVEKKALFEQKIDRMVVNVENSITSAGTNALEVLKRSPGVMVNRQTNSITMSGKEGVVVMINGKISRMPSEAVVEMLRGMSSDNISSIELIHTPPASFDAEGNAGFINIVLKKNQEEGINGGYSLTAGYGKKEKAAAAINFNVRKNKVNLFGDYSWTYTNNPQLFMNYRGFNYDGTYFESIGNYIRDSTYTHVQNARLGLDINVNDKTIIGGLVSWFDRNWQLDAVSTVLSVENGQQISRINIPNEELNHQLNLIGNINLQHQFDADSKLNIDLDYAFFNHDNPSNYLNQFYDANETLVNVTERRVAKNTPMTIWVGKIDYSKSISKNLNWEFGGKGTISEFDNTILVEDLISGNWEQVPLFSSEATMKENIEALYTSFTFKWSEKTDIKAGMRFEQTKTNLGSIEEPNIVDRNYGSWFPSLFFTNRIDKFNTLQFSYSRRINRPSYTQLAPWFIFLDPNTVGTGNPALQPSITDAFRGTYIWKTFQLGVQYAYTDQAIGRHQPSVDLETNTQVNSSKNFIDAHVASATLTMPFHLTKWWEFRSNWTAQWTKINDDIEGQKTSFERSSWYMNGTMTFTLPKKYTLELSGRYNSPTLFGIVQTQSANKVDIGIQKEFGNNSTLRFSVNDIFLGTNWRMSLDDPNIDFVYEGFYGFAEREFRLTYSARFGNTKMKGARKRTTGSEEEQRRAN